MKKLLLSLAFLSVLSHFSGLNAQKQRFYFGSQELTLAQAQVLIAQHDPQQSPQAPSKAGQKLQKPMLPPKPSERTLTVFFGPSQHKPSVPPKPRKQAPAKAFPATPPPTTGPSVKSKIRFFQDLGQ